MGRLIIDSNCVFEIDEECIKKRKISKDCDLEKYLTKEITKKEKKIKKKTKRATE